MRAGSLGGVRGAAVVLLVLAAAPVAAEAQQPPRRPVRTGEPVTREARPDSAGRAGATDTTRAHRELVQWSAPDSLMSALMARAGYVATRYQADTVIFDAVSREIVLIGNAAVQREQTVLVADTIRYSDTSSTILALGDTIVLRDPSRNAADLVARGRMVYDIDRREAIVFELCTALESGEKWYICGERGAFVQGDSVAGGNAVYVHSGSITSCSLTEPHYHFRVGEGKLVGDRILVARPALLYIRDIPVMWLPFIFQDLRSGRRSGILPPRLGVSDIVRNSPSYRRTVENLGYYFALSDYMDATVSLDWRSGAKAVDGDPGWLRYNGEWRYRWLDRFLSGRMYASHMRLYDGATNTALSWGHQQQFSQRSRLSADLNYVTNTRIQRDQALNVAQQLATITSRVNYQQQLGPANLSVSGQQVQRPGRDEVNRDFPQLNLATAPINVGNWLVWTPGLTLTNRQDLNIDQNPGGVPFRFSRMPDGGLDSVRVRANRRTTGLTFSTPLRIFGFDWSNNVAVVDEERDYPQLFPRVFPDVNDTSVSFSRVYGRTYATRIDWQTSFSLPRVGQGRWNIVPSLRVVNADPSLPFLVRTERSGTDFVGQSKRLEYGVSAAPTFFGFFPGLGPISRFRHSIQPSISYSYAPAGQVGNEFLAALGRTRVGYIGAIAQNRVSLGMSQTIEAKLRAATDTNPDAGEKIRLLLLNFSPLEYNFERARQTGGTGFATTNFSYSAQSDLLPGFDLTVGYSLFEGDPASDTARFKPYRENVSARMSFGRDRNPFAVLTRIFGRAVPSISPTSDSLPLEDDSLPSSPFPQPPIAGTADTRSPLGIGARAGWEASLQFTSSRPRPIEGANVLILDPREQCASFVDPIDRLICEQSVVDALPEDQGAATAGGIVTRSPPQATLRGNIAFHPTERWGLQWSTGYDFRREEFSDHIVSLQRELHDWRATFAFTQAPNGNFAFSFFISLIAQPELKFNYDRRTYRPGRR